MNTVELGEHAKLIRGVTFKPADKCDPEDEGAVVCMRTKNVQVSLDDSDLIAIPSGLVRNPEKMISTGDILVSSANSWNLVGKCCPVRELQYPSTAGGFISILRPTTECLDSDYLYRWFSSVAIQRQVRSFANQTTNISNLDHKRTMKLQIPLPPLAEQKRIAGILDAADALRAKRRESLAQLDTLLQSTFLEMFGDPVTNPMGWEAGSLGEVCLDKPAYGSGAASCDYDPALPRYVRITDVDDAGNLSEDPRCAQLAEDDVKKYQLHEGDVLFARSGATVGKSFLYRAEHGFCVYAGYMIRFRPDPDILLPEVLFRFTQTSAYWRWVDSNARAVAQPNINAKMYSALPVTRPPLDLQHRFAAIVESVEQQKASQRAHLEELDTLFASLQSRAFQGEL